MRRSGVALMRVSACSAIVNSTDAAAVDKIE